MPLDAGVGRAPTPDPSARAALVDHMIATFADPEQVIKRLTPWELTFVADVSEVWRRHRAITPRQFQVLEGIYTEKTA